MVNLQPTICNLCGGRVKYISNDKIYGRKYGSGFCYYCVECNAYVGTNKNKPKQALGILANKEMREWKQWCHSKFDVLWKGRQGFILNGAKNKEIKPIITRSEAYSWLSNKMNINKSDCHFGYFDLPTLKKAYAILKNKLKGEFYGK